MLLLFTDAAGNTAAAGDATATVDAADLAPIVAAANATVDAARAADASSSKALSDDYQRPSQLLDVLLGN
jgi:hypothetical protein